MAKDSLNILRSALPVNNLQSLLDAESNTEVDVIEIYFDDFNSDDDDQLLSVIERLPKPTIGTFRQPGFAASNYSESQKAKRITKFFDYIDYFDFDIYHEKSLMSALQNMSGQKKLIASFHQYLNCPNETELNSILGEFQNMQCSIAKIAWECQSEHALERLLQLAKVFRNLDKKFILSPMGRLGKVGRLVSSACGSEWIYCCSDTHSTAVGQLSLAEFKNYKVSVGLS